jgi:stress-induced-phosphoprotein 1
MSKDSWQHALDALPKTNLKPAEEVQKAQYEAGLKAATAAFDKAENTVFREGGTSKDHGLIIVRGEGRMPWDLAAAIIPRMRVQRPVNSAHIYSSVGPLIIWKFGAHSLSSVGLGNPRRI